MDDIFNALANPIRRNLLDRLHEQDGQTQTQLEQGQPVTRFGVMKHLRVLMDAHLITTRKIGREKHHYLNPVPIQELADRWISRFAAPFTRTMSDLVNTFERKDISMSDAGPTHVWEAYVRATPSEVWAIITDDAKSPLWKHFNMTSKTEWVVGGTITFLLGARPVIVGEVLEIDPPNRFVHSFSARWSPDVSADKPSRVTWQIEPIGDAACKIVLTHDDFGGNTTTSEAVGAGWPEELSRLKTLAETGAPLILPMPARSV